MTKEKAIRQVREVGIFDFFKSNGWQYDTGIADKLDGSAYVSEITKGDIRIIREGETSEEADEKILKAYFELSKM